MPTDPLTASRYPDINLNSPNVPQDIRNAVFDLAENTISRFTTTAARDSAWTAYTSAGGTLADGVVCYTEDAGYWKRHNGGWVSHFGLVGHGIWTPGGSGFSTVTSGDTRLSGGSLPLSAYLKAGRAYRFSGGLRAYSTVAGDIAQAAARISLSTSSSTAGDPIVAVDTSVIERVSGSLYLYKLLPSGTFQVNTSGNYVLSVWGSRPVGTGTVTFYPLSTGNLTAELHDAGIALSTVPAV